jgi:GATA-binding protein
LQAEKGKKRNKEEKRQGWSERVRDRKRESSVGSAAQKTMSSEAAQYGERGGGILKAHATSEPFRATSITAEEAQSTPTSSSASTSLTQHDYRFPRRPADHHQQASSSTTSSTAHARDSTTATTPVTDDKLDFSSADNSARKELLRESFFPSWKDDAASSELDSPDEMQKKDPLATQIWKLYSKTKKQLPNQERMENLTWRMMAMSLRKRRQEEEAARYVSNSCMSLSPRAPPKLTLLDVL